MKSSQGSVMRNSCAKALVSSALMILVGCGSGDDGDSADSGSTDGGGDNTDNSNVDGDATPSTESVNSMSAVGQLVSSIRDQASYTEAFSDNRIVEASGLQRSLQLEGVYYTHNDSGGEAVIYATDSDGQAFGSLTLTGVEANDWEAIAGASLDGEPHLIVGDIGDNTSERDSVQLYVVAEPNFDDLPIGFSEEVDSRRIELSYADGVSHNAEALLIDGDKDTVVVIAKDGQDTNAQSIWKGSLLSGLENGSMVLEYRGLVAIPLQTPVSASAITDIDIHPNGRDIAVLTYGTSLPAQGQVHSWIAREGEGTIDALARTADSILDVPLNLSPLNGQAEGISFSVSGDHLLVAAESLPRSVSTLTVISR